MVTISETARKKLLSIMENKKKSSFVRLGIKHGGCTGMSYHLSLESIRNKEDKLFKDKQIQILVDKNSISYLNGIILEYSDGLNGKGFYFKNPNAKHTCGCGKSFSV